MESQTLVDGDEPAASAAVALHRQRDDRRAIYTARTATVEAISEDRRLGAEVCGTPAGIVESRQKSGEPEQPAAICVVLMCRRRIAGEIVPLQLVARGRQPMILLMVRTSIMMGMVMGLDRGGLLNNFFEAAGDANPSNSAKRRKHAKTID
jgi:hypothetical protein